MAKNFYFGKQADIVAGSATFSSGITAGATSLGLTSAQATAFATLNSTLQAAYATATSPATRTKSAIEAKDGALENMRRSAILLSKIIYATSTVTDSQLVALGLLPRAVPGPSPIPSLAPIVEAVSVTNRLVKLKIRPGGTDKRARPAGCAGAQIYSYVGPTAPSEPRLYHYEGLATRNTVEILFPDSVVGGSTAWIAAAWVTQRGQPCIACSPIPVTIQGGAVLAKAA